MSRKRVGAEEIVNKLREADVLIILLPSKLSPPFKTMVESHSKEVARCPWTCRTVPRCPSRQTPPKTRCPRRFVLLVAAQQLATSRESVHGRESLYDQGCARGDHPFPANLADNPVHGGGREAAASEAVLFRERGQ
jgi:hypothetical protein